MYKLCFQVMCLGLCQWYRQYKLVATCQTLRCHNIHRIFRCIPNLHENRILSEFHSVGRQGLLPYSRVLVSYIRQQPMHGQRSFCRQHFLCLHQKFSLLYKKQVCLIVYN